MEENLINPYSRAPIIWLIVILIIIYILIEYWPNSCDRGIGKTSSLPTIPQLKWQNTGLITLWFDDAIQNQYTTAYKILQLDKLKAALSIPTNLVCKKGYMSWDEIRLLQLSGWETTAHTITHSCDLNFYDSESKTINELLGSKKILEEHGVRADQFVMPCGYSKRDIVDIFGDEAPPILAIAESNFNSYRTSSGVRINQLPILDPYNLKAFIIKNSISLDEIQDKINLAKESRGWLILVFHRIEDNSNNTFSISEAEFKEIISMVKNSGLPVVLPSQVLALQNEPQQN